MHEMETANKSNKNPSNNNEIMAIRRKRKSKVDRAGKKDQTYTGDIKDSQLEVEGGCMVPTLAKSVHKCTKGFINGSQSFFMHGARKIKETREQNLV